MQILPLTGEHDRERFDCGRPELNVWLQRIARQHQDKGLSRTYVAADEEAPARILGYYALTLTEIDAADLPEAARKRFPRRIPGVRLGRVGARSLNALAARNKTDKNQSPCRPSSRDPCARCSAGSAFASGA